MQRVVLESNDGQAFTVDMKIAEMSNTLKTMFQDLGVDATKEELIPLPNVNSPLLKKVIEWCEYHKDDHLSQENEDSTSKCTDLSDWDDEFFQLDQNTVFELLKVANYLDIRGLFDCGCKKVASMLKGKSAQKIREDFNIQNDFSPEEEEQLRKENDWLEEK